MTQFMVVVEQPDVRGLSVSGPYKTFRLADGDATAWTQNGVFCYVLPILTPQEMTAHLARKHAKSTAE